MILEKGGDDDIEVVVFYFPLYISITSI